MKRLAIILLLAGSLSAQTANVIELSPADTITAKAAWQNLQDAEKKWKDEQSVIGRKYATLPGNPGFEHGFEFSKDFKYIVPKPNTGGTASTTTAWPVVNCPGGTGPCLLVK